jgi:hypothetical protein
MAGPTLAEAVAAYRPALSWPAPAAAPTACRLAAWPASLALRGPWAR